jgi:hypothetical protein
MDKKIYITETQRNRIIESRQEFLKKKKELMDYIKADRKARREEAREIYGDGFKSNTRIAASDKKYTRKGKKKFKYDNINDID